MSPDDHANATAVSPFLWAIDQARARKLTQAELMVLAVMAHSGGELALRLEAFRQKDTWTSDQTIADIALLGRMSERKVTAAIRKLEAEGLVITIRRSRQSSVYRIIRNATPPFQWPWEEGATS